MPNGRSGGFLIEKGELKQLLETVSDLTAIGRTLHANRLRHCSAAEAARYVEECPHDQIPVEEQDKKCYVMHLSNEPEIVWVIVDSEMPIFADLRQLHARWMTEHREWMGWMVF